MGPGWITGGLFALGLATSSEGVDRVVAEGERMHPSDDPTAAATVREAPDRAHAFTDLGTILRTVPGVQVQRAGAPGSFLGVSIRGATLQQTAVFVGDLEVSGADSGAFDLGVFPPDLFEAVEVYRGGAPAWLSSGAIGGVVRLVPHSESSPSPSGAAVQGGFGSFGSSYANLRARDRSGPVRVTAAGGVLDSDNDFPYLDDNGTRFDPSDDRERRRINADLTQAHGAQYTEVEVGPGRFSVATIAIHREQGEPDSAAVPSTATRRERAYLFGSAGYTGDAFVGSRPLRFQIAGGLSLDDDRVRDPRGDLGLGGGVPKTVASELWTGRLRAAASLGLTDWLDASAIGTLSWEGYTSDERTVAGSPDADPDRPRSERRTQAAAVELAAHGELGGRRLEARASVRVQATRAEVSEVSFRGAETRRIDRVDPTVRLAGRWDLLEPLALVASYANGVRLPSSLELFGDRVNLRGNPFLEPERGHQGDVGFRGRLASGALELDAEVRLFGLWLRDLIVLERTTAVEFIPFNEDSGRVLGLEAGASFGITEHLVVSGAVTVQDTRNDLGNPLPLRAPWVGYAQVRARTGALGPVHDLSTQIELAHRAEMPGSSSPESARIPERTTVDVGLELATGSDAVRFYAEVRDVFDRAGFDFLGFPVPGRRFELGLQMRQSW